MKRTVIAIAAVISLALGVWWIWGLSTAEAPVVDDTEDGLVTCRADAKMCPDGSSVGRQGPACDFSACPSKPVDSNVTAAIAELEDRITVTTPEPGAYVASPLRIAGEARGTWFFEEGDFAVVLTDWDGRIIAEAPATAQADWMTEDWVSFIGELSFTSPYREADPEYMQRGTLILQRANPSGLPEQAAALEFPVWFRPES